MMDRAQGFTLEGVIGALVLLSAVLFAAQSVALTPSSGGDVDAADRQNLRQQATDVLVLASQNDTFSLSTMARYWDQSKRTFHGALTPRIGYGDRNPPGALGKMLNQTFSEPRRYNLELRYLPANASGRTGRIPVVFQGSPDGNAVVTTRTVTLFDNQTLTSPGASGVELWEYGTELRGGEGFYPIPNAVDGPVYNVVEVRLTVW